MHVLFVIAQESSVELAVPYLGNWEFVVRDEITLSDGFEYKATQNEEFIGRIDKNLIIDVGINPLLTSEDLVINKNLPTGTIQGVFNVSESGAATYNIPIKVTPGTKGMQPNISISYNNQSGSGLLGVGWNLSGISMINRAPQNYEKDGKSVAVDLTSTDRFVWNGNRLVVSNGGDYGANNTVYATEMESHTEIISYGGSTENGPEWFKVKTIDGKIIEYGNGNGSRYTINDKNIFWKINKITDQAGNYMTYHYSILDDQHVISEIKYTGNISSPYNSVQFFYERKPDASISYIGGKAIYQNLVLYKIDIRANNELSHYYTFKYGRNDNKLLLNEILEYGNSSNRFNSTKLQYDNVQNNYSNGYHAEIATGSIALDDYENIIIGDYNGDGKQDFILRKSSSFKMYISNGDNSFIEKSVTGNNLGISTHDYNGDGKDEFYVIKEYNLNTIYNEAHLYELNESNNIINLNQSFLLDNGRYLYSFDIDGDGIPEYIIIDALGNVIDISLNGTFYLPEISCPDLKNYANFNGNSQIDFFYIDNNEVEIYEYVAEYGYIGLELIASITLPGNPDFYDIADFNGDGKDDLFYEKDNEVKIYLFNGEEFIEKSDYILNDYSETCKANNQEEIITADFNGDGYEDILKYFEDAGIKEMYVYYSNGDGFENPIKCSTNIPDLINAYTLDLNGDGKREVFNTAINQNLHFISFKPSNYNQFVTSITNGVGLTTSIAYNSISENSSNYSKGSETATFPVSIIQKPMHVVKNVVEPNGIGGQTTISYNYEGARAHFQGIGFLGFDKIVTNNSSANVEVTETKTMLDASSYFTESLTQTTTKAGNNISQITTNFEVTPIPGEDRYFQHITSKSETDINNTTSSYSYEYENYMLKKETIQYSGGTTEKIETNYTYSDLSTTSFNLKQPTTITNTRTLDGDIFTTTTVFSNFNGDKFPQSISLNGFTTTNTYDDFGNIIEKSQFVDGVERKVEYTYESTGRFLQTKTTNDEYTESYSYNNKGLLLSQTGINGLSTSYTYDAFGRLISTTLPDGNTISKQINWDNNTGDNIEYFVKNTIPGSSDSWEYFDILGRVIKTETEGVGSLIFANSTAFNSDGSVATKSFQDKQTTYQYNTDGRIESTTVDGITTSLSYTGRTVSITHPNGETSSKTYDGAGRLRSATDNGGTITYKYAGCGKTDEINHDNSKTITMSYDNFGYQTQLLDPDVGTYLYNYNEIGEIKSTTNPNSKITNFTYDNYGRLVQKSFEEGTINYNYFSSGNGIGQLQSIVGYNNINQEYTYDNLGRVSNALENILGESSLMRTFSYDSYSNLISESYDADNNGSVELTVENEYDKGILNKIKLGSDIIWQLQATNNYGQITSYDLGRDNVLLTYNTNGYIENVNYDRNYQIGYNFDPATGNLLERSNTYSNLTETFSYDNLNRLENISHNNTIVQTMTYNSSGNIMSKTNAGYYFYEQTRPGAVAKISTDKDALNPDGDIIPQTYDPPIPTDISQDIQNITYSSFNKATLITEGSNSIGITYGPGNFRKKMINNDGTNTATTYYHGNYEKEVKGTVTKKTFYIHGLNGLAAMYVLNNSSSTLYKVFTDHLGSIVALKNADNEIIEEYYSYDAWGRRRNPLDYSYTGFSHDLTNRGYTGHEHLDNIDIINMNGRIYDPIVGRMLSPDNLIQAPDYSQNLNRYSYVLNNPLKYADPSGNAIWGIMNYVTEGANWLSQRASGNDEYKFDMNYIRTGELPNHWSKNRDGLVGENGYPIGLNGEYNAFGEYFGQAPWMPGTFTDASGAEYQVGTNGYERSYDSKKYKPIYKHAWVGVMGYYSYKGRAINGYREIVSNNYYYGNPESEKITAIGSIVGIYGKANQILSKKIVPTISKHYGTMPVLKYSKFVPYIGLPADALSILGALNNGRNYGWTVEHKLDLAFAIGGTIQGYGDIAALSYLGAKSAYKGSIIIWETTLNGIEDSKNSIINQAASYYGRKN